MKVIIRFMLIFNFVWWGALVCKASKLEKKIEENCYILLSAEDKLVVGITTNGADVDCENKPNPIVKIQNFIKEISQRILVKSTAKTSVDITKISLDSTKSNPEILFALLNKTEIGKGLLKSLLPAYKTGEIEIVQLTDSIRIKKKIPDRVQAIFSFSNFKRIIYVDFNKPLGGLVMEFAHEAGHSIDKETLSKFTDYAKLTEAERKVAIHQIKFETETFAYRIEEEFVKQMGQNIKCSKLCKLNCYSEYLDRLIAARVVPPYSMSSDEIIKNYGLSCEHLNKGICK